MKKQGYLVSAIIVFLMVVFLFALWPRLSQINWSEIKNSVLSAVGLSSGEIVYYVNASIGNDNYTGLCQTVSANNCGPFKTIQKGANTSSAGSIISVAPGTYNEKISVTRSGSSSSPITFKAESPGVNTYGFIVNGYNYIVIDGFNVSIPKDKTWDVWGKGAGIALLNTNYSVVKNNQISNTLREGISLDSSLGTNNSVINNKIAYAGAYAGIVVSGNNHLIEGNDISHTIQHPLYPTLSSAGGPDADGIKFKGSGHIFRRNYIHDITLNDPGNVSPHIDGFQAAGDSSNITFDGNIISLLNPATYTQGLYLDDYPNYSNIIVRNNIIQVCQPINFDTVNGSMVENNTIRSYGCLSDRCNGRVCDGIQLTNSPNVKIKNNIFYSLRSYLNVLDSVSKTGLVVSNNGFFDSASTLAGGLGYGTSPVNSDPKFVNATVSAFNYRLQADSLMIDKGLNVDVSTDLEGNARPQGISHDLGAYEIGGSVVVVNQIDTTAPITTANPIGGTYTSAQTVTLTTNEPAMIQYCLGDGCQPYLDYSSPLNIVNSQILRYHAKDTAGNIEAVKTSIYTITEAVVEACVESWSCGEWSTCSLSGTQTRVCVDSNNCDTTKNKPVETQTCTPPSQTTSNGLLGQYYGDKNLSLLKFTRVDSAINFDWGDKSPSDSLSVDNFSVRWTGRVKVNKSGWYTFYVASDDGARLWIDNNKLIDAWYDHSLKKFSRITYLSSGFHDIKLEYYENSGRAAVMLSWKGPGIATGIIPQSNLYPATQ